MKNELQRYKKSDKIKWASTCAGFALVLVMVAGLCLQVFGKGKAKPSEWFKQEETVEESTDIENNVEHTAGKARPYASAYSTDDSTVSPACEHVPETIMDPVGYEYDYGYYYTVSKVDRSLYLSGADRLTGAGFMTGNRIYPSITEYQASGRSGVSKLWVICIHGINSTYMRQYGYFYTNFEINYTNLSSSSVYYGKSNKPVIQEEIYDAETDTLRLITSPVGVSWSNESTLSNYYLPTYCKVDKAKYVPSNPTKEGHTFTGWYTDEACTNRFDDYIVADDTTLYAGWQINTYTLTLIGNGGECASSVSGDYNTVLTIPTPTRMGYTFTGWKTADGEAYDITTPLTQDITLTAQWQINDYTVILKGNGGEPSETSVTGNYGDVPAIPTPTRTGYTFTGWQTADGEAYDITTPLTQDLTLTAQWQINTYTLTLNGNGGELSATSVSGDYNTIPEIPTPTRTGYNFTGWKAGNNAYDVTSPLTQDLTLVAQWQIKTYTVTFMVDGAVYQTMTVEHGTKLVYVTESAEPALFALYSVNESGLSVAADYAIDGDITVYAEEGTTAQKVKGNWWKILIGGVAGAAGLALICSIPSMIKRKKRR